MADFDIREFLHREFEGTLDARAERWAEAGSTTFHGDPPQEVWDYAHEIHRLYTDGYFAATILLAVALCEGLLEQELVKRTPMSGGTLQNLGLQRLTEMAKDFAIITPEAAREIQARAEKRNALAHLNVKKLRKGVRPPSDDIGWGGLVIEWREGTLGHPKMQKEALRALKLASVLCEKFYGPPPNHQ